MGRRANVLADIHPVQFDARAADLILAGRVCEIPGMALRSLQALLEKNFHPPAAGEIDAIFRLAVAEETLTFEVRHGVLDFRESAECDATFYFEDVDTAWALLSGQADAFDAFMNGRFRADGYLLWAFALMAMFRSGSLPENPVE
jgi:hypothetical protein